MEMTGGNLYCNKNDGGATDDALRLGAGPGTGLAVINMSGGTITTYDRIRIGSGYPGKMLMSGDSAVYTGNLWIAPDDGLLDISSEDAVFYISGNHTDTIHNHINEGRITAFGGPGTVIYDYNQTLAGYTTIKALPEHSEPASHIWTDAGTDSIWSNGDNWSTGNMPESSGKRVSIKELSANKRGPIITADMTTPPGYETLVARSICFEPPESQVTVMTVESAQLQLTEKLWLIAGMATGRAILEINGGHLDIGTELRVGGFGTKGGHIQLNEGTISTASLTLRANSSIDIKNSGKLVIDSDISDYIQNAVNTQTITAYNGTGQVLIDYDSAGDKTTVSAQMLTKEASINVKTGEVSEWSVDRLLNGRFFEHHGCDVYPGVYEQYIVNTSFEQWYRKDENSPTPLKDVKERLVFSDIEESQGIAYPWEPYGSEYDPMFELSSTSFNSETSQKIVNTVDYSRAYVGVKQRIALPDYRTDQYRIKLYAKTDGQVEEIYVILRNYETNEVFDSIKFQLTQQWQPFEGIFDVDGCYAATKLHSRRGIYELAVIYNEPGGILLDQLTMFPTDAVDEQYNPETIKTLQDTGLTSIRWPGGNFASGYAWRDGIGPVENRPTRPNLAWAGLENNHMGTDEFLEFCEIVGLTPIICVGFDFVSVQDAANWVEYVNGCPETTRYGELRAQNGRYEPYDVELWQIGNEVYGSYQIGHTDAEDYATRYLDYYTAMKDVDPDIKLMSMGRDPGYHTDDDNAWNKALFEIIGDKMSYMDIHRYVRGVRDEDELEQWDLNHLSEIYLSYPTQYENIIIDSIEQLTGPQNYDLPNLKLAVTEWAQYLSLEKAGVPNRWSQANAVFYAGMMNVFIRNGDFAKISCSHDFSVFAGSRKIPPSPRNEIAKLYSDITNYQVLKTEVTCDSFDMEDSVPQMQTVTDIPYLDAVTLKNASKNEIVLFVVNRSLTSSYDVEIKLEGVSDHRSANVSVFSVNEDYMDFTPNCMAAQTWNEPKQSQIIHDNILTGEGTLNVKIPACSVAKVRIKNFDFVSFAIFADKWYENCDIYNKWCKGADFDRSGYVDTNDLTKFTEDW